VGNKTDLEENHRLPEQEIRAVSPASRMARFIELQKRAFALLAASPDGSTPKIDSPGRRIEFDLRSDCYSAGLAPNSGR
jgi:hypothetical protein